MKRYVAVLEIEDDVEIVGDIEAVANYTYRDNGTNYAYTESVEFKLEQEPKTGHWIDDKCSVCGKGTEDLIDSREWYQNEEPKYCPFCGVKLVDS